MTNELKRLVRDTFLNEAINWVRYRWELLQWISGRLNRAPHLLKRMLVRQRAKTYGLKVFVETGTLFGDMTYAMRHHFNELITIELDDYLYHRATRRFRNIPRVRLLHGDSGVQIVEALRSIHQPALFWLDAHYSGGITARGDEMTPVFSEIRHILAHQVSNHVIVVDDARLFDGTDGYPTFRALQDFVASIDRDCLTWIENDTISIARGS